MKVTWRESKIPGDILGRRFSGVDSGMEPPEDSDFFDVPHSHACTSAFAHPRLIKEICRRGLKGWVDVDVVNSVFSQFEANFQECPDVVKRYNRDRDGMIAAVCSAYGCSRDVAKRLFICLGFMGKLESWLEDFGLKRIDPKARWRPNFFALAGTCGASGRPWWRRILGILSSSRTRSTPWAASCPRSTSSSSAVSSTA